MEISEEELAKCELALITFVCHYKMLYGETTMTFNVHVLLHVVKSIRKTGPLWVNSAFLPESNIYTLKKFVNGPKRTDRQMCRKSLQLLSFKTGNTEDIGASKDVAVYCMKLFTPKRLTTFFEKTDENVTYFGRSFLTKVDGIGKCLSYKKCAFQGTIHHSIHYKRASKTDDTVVQLKSKQFGPIIKILKVNTLCYLSIAVIEVFTENPFPGVNHITKIKCEEEKPSLIVSINDVKQKLILINVKNARYLCSLPNTIEIQ